nr:hypothetical protein F511_25198 [Tanacetum cinerariifolium]
TGNAPPHQIAPHGFRPLLREAPVQGRVALVIGVALHLQAQFRRLRQGRSQRIEAGSSCGQQISLALRKIEGPQRNRLPTLKLTQQASWRGGHDHWRSHSQRSDRRKAGLARYWGSWPSASNNNRRLNPGRARDRGHFGPRCYRRRRQYCRVVAEKVARGNGAGRRRRRGEPPERAPRGSRAIGPGELRGLHPPQPAAGVGAVLAVVEAQGVGVPGAQAPCRPSPTEDGAGCAASGGQAMAASQRRSRSGRGRFIRGCKSEGSYDSCRPGTAHTGTAGILQAQPVAWPVPVLPGVHLAGAGLAWDRHCGALPETTRAAGNHPVGYGARAVPERGAVHGPQARFSACQRAAFSALAAIYVLPHAAAAARPAPRATTAAALGRAGAAKPDFCLYQSAGRGVLGGGLRLPGSAPTPHSPLFLHIGWALALTPISFLAAVYYLAYCALRQREVFAFPAPARAELQELLQEAPASATPVEPVRQPRLSASQVQYWQTQLQGLLTTEKVYLEADLNLPGLAQKAGLTTHELSFVLNEGFGVNFFQFINGYRVEEAKRLLTSAQHQHLSMVGIAFEAGFSSKTTFNTTFKKVTGLTPSQFLQQGQAGKTPLPEPLGSIQLPSMGSVG